MLIYHFHLSTKTSIKIIKKHAPIKTVSKRKKKLLAKPWITRGIRNSIRIKNKLYRTGDEVRYKYYRNTICKLTRQSKKQYFSDYLNYENLNNIKKTWQGINDVLNRIKVHNWSY